MKTYIFVLLCGLLFVSEAFGQRKKEIPLQSILINSNKPTVFIEFERSGKAEPLFEGENEERIWLRLQNNTKWELSLCSFTVEKEYGDVGIPYDVKLRPTSGVMYVVKNEEEQKLRLAELNRRIAPQGYSTGDICREFAIPTGKSVVFSVPQEHLKDYLYLSIEFWYDWENRDNELGSFPRHYLLFSYN